MKFLQTEEKNSYVSDKISSVNKLTIRFTPASQHGQCDFREDILICNSGLGKTLYLNALHLEWNKLISVCETFKLLLY